MHHNIDLTVAALHYSAVYFAIIVICGVLLAFGKTRGVKKKRCVVLVSVIFFVLIAFRGESMGNDTNRYIAMFEKISTYRSPQEGILDSSTESGFLLYCWLLSRIVNDARIVFAISAAFIVWSLGRFAYKYVDDLGVFYCLFVGTLYFDFFLSGMRNAISIAIFLFAVDYLLERKALPYFLICTLAMLFHNTAITYFAVYPLFSPKALAKKSGVISGLLLIVAAFLSGYFFNYLLGYFFRIFPKYTYYIGGEMLDGKMRIAVLLKIAVCMLLIIVPKLVRKVPTKMPELDSVGKRMAMLNLLVMFVAVNATAFMRMVELFQIFTLMQYSNEVERMPRRSANRVWLITLTLVAFYIYGLVLVVLKTPDWQTTYPIQLSWWIN